MKKCKKCGRVQDLSCFYKQKEMVDGYRNYCKYCWKNSNKINNKINKENYSKVRKEWIKNVKSKYGLGYATINRFGLKLALLVYDRAERKCELCGNENDLTIHHIDGKGRHNEEKGLPVNNEISNLQVLCRSCHGGLHSKLYWREKKDETGN